MNVEYGDVVVIKVGDREHRSKISKVDGKVVKLLDENGSYRQMAAKDLEEMINNGFAYVEKSRS
jgi:SOS-response transcriptional repressor LexA